VTVPRGRVWEGELWVRLAGQGRIGNLDEKLVQKRAHEGAWSATNRACQRRVAGQIAGRYGASLGIGFDENTFASLYSWLWYGEEPPDWCVDGLVAAFRAAVRHFRRKATEDRGEELENSIAYLEERMRWRCLKLASSSLWASPTRG
jgi:hypothetical protein